MQTQVFVTEKGSGCPRQIRRGERPQRAGPPRPREQRVENPHLSARGSASRVASAASDHRFPGRRGKPAEPPRPLPFLPDSAPGRSESRAGECDGSAELAPSRPTCCRRVRPAGGRGRAGAPTVRSSAAVPEGSGGTGPSVGRKARSPGS